MGAIHRVVPADQHGVLYWMHGPSGSGKTRLAIDFAKPGWLVLDADDAREWWPELGFSQADRWTQNLRLANIALNANKQGIHVCVASICPYVDLRREIKNMIPWVNWVCVFGPDSRPSSEEPPFEEGGWV